MKMRVGFIGAGVMGHSMAGHLLGAGHEVRVFTRTAARADDLVARGASRASTAREAAEAADAVISIVGFPEDVEQVHLGAEGTLAAERLPALLVDMTTSTPSLAERLAEAARERGLDALDAPVSGGDRGAREATLSIMVGGAEAPFARALPLFEVLGRKIVHCGPPGAGQHTKMANQILVASSMLGACEAIRYAEAARLDPARVLDAVRAGAAGSWTLENLAPRMLAGDFEPGFFVEHFVKDLGIALAEAEQRDLDLPGLREAARLYRSLLDGGLGRKGTQALLRLYRGEVG